MKYKLSADDDLMLSTYSNPVRINRVTGGDSECMDVP